jgi:hypothetical protein
MATIHLLEACPTRCNKRKSTWQYQGVFSHKKLHEDAGNLELIAVFFRIINVNILSNMIFFRFTLNPTENRCLYSARNHFCCDASSPKLYLT